MYFLHISPPSMFVQNCCVTVFIRRDKFFRIHARHISILLFLISTVFKRTQFLHADDPTTNYLIEKNLPNSIKDN
jgi:hypothetical protein